MERLTKGHEYEPTRKEWQLLRVLQNPEYIEKNITEICEIAGVSRQFYYQTMKKKEFTDYIRDTAHDMIKRDLYQLWNVASEQAKKGNHAFWRSVMDSTGQYTEKQKIEVEVSGKLEDYF